MLQPRNQCLPWTHHLTSLCFQTGLCLLRVEWHFPDLRLGLKSIVPNSFFFSLVWTLGSCTQSSSSHAARSRKVVAPWAKQHKLVCFRSRIYKWSKFLSFMGTLADFLSFPIFTFTDVLASVLALYLAVNLYFFSPPTPHICGRWSDVPKRTGHEAMIQQLRCSEEPPWVLVQCQRGAWVQQKAWAVPAQLVQWQQAVSVGCEQANLLPWAAEWHGAGAHSH